jgi:large subunit ribosomal protein L17
MRHGKRFNHLGRTASHRKAMLSNMASSLLVNKRINTTLAKAKELRKYVEPLITKAKNDSTHSRRVVFSYLQDKESVNALFNEVVDRVAGRPGGYTRIIKLGSRLGDNAEMAMIELVDFNDLLIQESEPKKAKTRRSRRGGAKPKQEPAAAKADAKTEKKEEEVKAESEEKVESTAAEDAAETKVEEVQEEAKEEVVETKAEATKAEETKVEETKVEEAKEEEVKAEEAAEEVKAKSKPEAESAEKAENKDEDKKESEESGKEKNEK